MGAVKNLRVPQNAGNLIAAFFRTVMQCGVTRLGEDWLATSWPTAWVKVLRLCFPMINDADLLEAAVTLVVIVKSSWSTVEIIVQASDDIIKVVPKMKNRSSNLYS